MSTKHPGRYTEVSKWRSITRKLDDRLAADKARLLAEEKARRVKRRQSKEKKEKEESAK